LVLRRNWPQVGAESSDVRGAIASLPNAKSEMQFYTYSVDDFESASQWEQAVRSLQEVLARQKFPGRIVA
jgi:hypothetical protein